MSGHTLVWTPKGFTIRMDHPNTEEARCGWWGNELTTGQYAELVEQAKTLAATMHADAPDQGWDKITDWSPSDVAEVCYGSGEDAFALADGTQVRHNGDTFYAVVSWCSLTANDRISVEEMIEGAEWDGAPVEIPVASIVGFELDDEYAVVTRLSAVGGEH